MHALLPLPIVWLENDISVSSLVWNRPALPPHPRLQQHRPSPHLPFPADVVAVKYHLGGGGICHFYISTSSCLLLPVTNKSQS